MGKCLKFGASTKYFAGVIRQQTFTNLYQQLTLKRI